MQARPTRKKDCLTPSAVLLAALVVCGVSDTSARGLRQLQPVPAAPTAGISLHNAEATFDRSSDTATTDLERLLNNSLIMQSASRSAAQLSLSQAPNQASLGILLRSRPRPNRDRVTQALESTLAAWGTPELESILSSGYYDANRLQNEIRNRVPTDARLELLRLEDYRIIEDSIVTTATNNLARVWLIVANAITQVELNDPIAGFVNVRGRQRYTFHLFDVATLSDNPNQTTINFQAYDREILR